MLKKLASLFLSICLIISLTIPVYAESRLPSGNENAIAGQLIVSVENTQTMSAKGIETNNELFTKSLNTSIFNVKDALLESTGIGDSQNIGIQSNDVNLKDIVLEKMGHVYLVEYPSNEYSYNQAKAMLNSELTNSGYQVKSIEPNYIMKATAIETTPDIGISSIHPSQQWQYDMIKAPDAWTVSPGSSSTKVAILDTGADYNHPSLRNYINTSLAKNYSGGATNDIMDRQNHGTHVAGTISSYGSVSGVMQTASLIPVKVLGDDGKGSMYGIEQGVLYAASIDADVINMSLGGGGYSSSFDQACQSATTSGTVIVCASGNEYASSISYPAAYSSCIAVGAVDSNRARASFSNYGTGLAVMAPGVSVYSTLPNSQYGTMSGTSMASPHVAGVVGLLRSANPNATVAQIRNALTSTAQSAGNQLQYGYGIVNSYAAIKAIGGTPIEKVATPTFNPASGSYTSPVSVSINCDTAGSTIRYTTNGTEPTTTSAVYSNPITVSQTTSIKAKAFKTGLTDSDVATALYTIAITPIDQVATPVISPSSGTYNSEVTVSISCATTGATIRYTIDGSDPTSSSTVYSGSFAVSSSATVKAKAFKSGMTDSAIVSATYIIDNGGSTYPNWASGTAYKAGDLVSYNGKTYECRQPHTSLTGWEPANVPALWIEKTGTTPPIQTVATPSFNPTGGNYTTPINVSISCSTTDAVIRYTTDGSNPTTSSAIYSSPINFSTTTTLKAKAFKTGMNASSVATATYTIGSEPTQTVATPSFNPASGNYTAPVSVNISCATTGATIRYTTDGSDPTASSPIYSSALNFSTTTTLKAKAFKVGMNDSSIAAATYTIGNSSIEVWKEYKAYKTGDIVSYNGVNYKCVQSHTALSGWEPSYVPALWQVYNGATVKK